MKIEISSGADTEVIALDEGSWVLGVVILREGENDYRFRVMDGIHPAVGQHVIERRIFGGSIQLCVYRVDVLDSMMRGFEGMRYIEIDGGGWKITVTV